jgi:hypothetical protein
MRTLVAATALLSSLALAGCFVTEKPLIDVKSAAHPIAAGTHYIQYFDNGQGWKEHGRGVVSIKDGWYDAVNKGEEKDDVPFVLAPWGKNFIAMNRLPNDKGQTVYGYAILQPIPGGYLEYAPDCANFGGGDALKKKKLVNYRLGQDDACAPVSMAALQTLMQMVLDSKAMPDNKYVVVK